MVAAPATHGWAATEGGVMARITERDLERLQRALRDVDFSIGDLDTDALAAWWMKCAACAR